MRYFLHICDEHRVIDREGSDLPDLAAARDEAIEAARELMASAILEGYDISHQSFEIEDERSQIVMRVPFTEAIGTRPQA